jgi:transporter family-2 protein
LILRLAVAAAIFAGVLNAFVAPMDGGLGKRIGSLPAALVDFGGGLIVLLVILACTRQFGQVRAARHQPPLLLVGGLCGVVFVTAGVVTIEPLGAGGVAAATVTGQLIASVLIDRAGLLGVPRTRISPIRLAGVALLIGGTLLIAT